MPGRWIRLDVDWEDSAWLDALPGVVSGCWPRLLCHVKRTGVRGRCRRPDHTVIARRWNVTRDIVTELEQAALADDALRIESGEWVVANWETYQLYDETGAERQRRRRAKQKKNSNLQESRRDGVTDRDSRDVLSRDIDRDKDIDSTPVSGSTEVPGTEAESETIDGGDTQVIHSRDPTDDFKPSPNYKPNELRELWEAERLPFPHSVHWAIHEQALHRLHSEPPHWSRKDVERAIMRLADDKRSAQDLEWVWQKGPQYLEQRAKGLQVIEHVLNWKSHSQKSEPGRETTEERIARRKKERREKRGRDAA